MTFVRILMYTNTAACFCKKIVFGSLIHDYKKNIASIPHFFTVSKVKVHHLDLGMANTDCLSFFILTCLSWLFLLLRKGSDFTWKSYNLETEAKYFFLSQNCDKHENIFVLLTTKSSCTLYSWCLTSCCKILSLFEY